MKLVKMSLAAAVLLGASAFAIDNVKVSGDAKLYYMTNDAGDSDLFDKDSSAADTALRLSVTGDLTKNVSFGVTGYAVSTLGLENNLVSNTWTGAHGLQTGTGNPFLNSELGGVQVDDQAWIGEMWVAGTMGKTTAKLGRMELDTPLAFSEKWSIVPNTFDAAVLINQDIPDTTLVGAWVGKGNGVNAIGVATSGAAAINNSTLIGDNVVGLGADFNTFLSDGAYAVAIVNNSFKPLTAQAWYYNVQNVADAYWLQADINCQLVKGLTIGAQYADISTKGLLDGAGDSSAYAFKLGYAGVENLSVSGAYSKADDEGTLKVANVATNNLGGAQSKLYTEAWWNYGYVGAPDAEAWNLTAEYDIKDVVKVGAYYTNVTDAFSYNSLDKVDMQEITLSATKSFGPLDASLVYISTDADDQNNGSQYNTLQAYLTLNF
ncbi:MAG: OprD family outer membrane porin [Sulfuricurvum sp.]|uniref:OprD family outer membrane porin n=1 Tax=Sulfuricurvum sp. TaxID=2025608 RepID=UPI00356B0806